MSYMQLGSATFAVLVPFIATAIKSATGTYRSLYWGATVLLLSAGAAMLKSPPPPLSVRPTGTAKP